MALAKTAAHIVCRGGQMDPRTVMTAGAGKRHMIGVSALERCVGNTFDDNSTQTFDGGAASVGDASARSGE